MVGSLGLGADLPRWRANLIEKEILVSRYLFFACFSDEREPQAGAGLPSMMHVIQLVT
jgi:hypothetical protein